MKLLSTSTQVWMFLLFVSLGFLILGYEWGGRAGLFIGLGVALALHLFIFVFGEGDLLRKFRIVRVEGRDPWGLSALVEEFSRQLNIVPAPRISLADSRAPLAFSLAQPWRRGHLVLSSGLLEKLTRRELEAVVAHQLGHLRNMDSFRFGVVAGGIRMILGLATCLDRLWIPNLWLKRRQEPFLHLFAPLAWLILRLAVNAKSYFRNDDLAAYLTQDKAVLAEALWKLDGLARTRPQALPPCSSYHFFINPQQGSTNPWLESHPPVSTRIRRLIGTDAI